VGLYDAWQHLLMAVSVCTARGAVEELSTFVLNSFPACSFWLLTDIPIFRAYIGWIATWFFFRLLDLDHALDQAFYLDLRLEFILGLDYDLLRELEHSVGLCKDNMRSFVQEPMRGFVEVMIRTP